MPTEGDLSPHAMKRVCTEAATVSFAVAARKINMDWGTHLDGKQIQRWSERVGDRLVDEREHALKLLEKNHIPPVSKLNEHEVLVIGMDGGRVQHREKNQDGTRWREDKVLTVTSYLKGDETKQKKPQKLLNSYMATMQDAAKFGRLARLEAERRGIRKAHQTVVLGDGATWINTIAEKHFPHAVRIVDWYHATEHLHEAAKAAVGDDEPKQKSLAEKMKSMLWEGEFDALMKQLDQLSTQAGEPPAMAMETDPRKVLKRTVGYFASRRDQMDYPRYRKNGWPIGSGVVESGVKLFNKRVKGTEQFWSLQGSESIMAVRAAWLSEETEFYQQLYPCSKQCAA
jgi:hypothetical protein